MDGFATIGAAEIAVRRAILQRFPPGRERTQWRPHPWLTGSVQYHSTLAYRDGMRVLDAIEAVGGMPPWSLPTRFDLLTPRA
jgi:hypothetical protein